MKIGMIGLGRMGGNMAKRLLRGGHGVAAFDYNPAAAQALAADGAEPAASLAALAKALPKPRVVWVMVPAGGPTEDTVMALAAELEAGDIVIDGGNSYFKDDVRRAGLLKAKGIHYLDAGTSGGVWGLERGYCLMVGGPAEAFKATEAIFKTLAPGKGDIPVTPNLKAASATAEQGYLYCGPSGSGHFVKMIHNGIEYGLMQAYAEGFDILRGAASDKLPAGERYQLPLDSISELWRRGSVVSSWLLDLTALALNEDAALSGFTGSVEDSGEGRWTVQAAVDEAVPAEVLTASLFARFRSRQDHTFGEKMLSAMRHGFGGHVEKK
ncbi:MAG TPA: decarboxylating 6-phosphogluconate dehydrogenase [bacterium]|nr:decarboxylating 6-phosphogluconate dehydrogenase [bacterium]